MQDPTATPSVTAIYRSLVSRSCFMEPHSVKRRIALVCSALLLVTGCGDEAGKRSAETAPTTIDMTSTTIPATPTSTEADGPNVSQRALDFLDCESIWPPQGGWAWICRRGKTGMALITDDEYTVREFVDQARSDVKYNPQSSLLFQTPGGYVFVVGFDGFEHVHSTLGELPDLDLIDTDEFPPSPPPNTEVCDTDPCHGPGH